MILFSQLLLGHCIVVVSEEFVSAPYNIVLVLMITCCGGILHDVNYIVSYVLLKDPENSCRKLGIL